MKNIKILMKSSIIMIIVLATSVFCNKVYAADLAVSASGSKVTISSQYTGKVTVSVSGGKASESSVWLEGNSQTISISDVAESGATVTVTPVSLADENGNLKKDVSAKSVKIAGTSTNTGTSTSRTNTPKTNENTTTTQKEPSFKSVNEEVYATGNINVRKSYSADSDKLGSLQKGEKVTRTGVGDNGWSKVTYNGATGYIKSDLLTKEEPKKSEDKALKSLEIEGITLDPVFDPEITDYTISLEKDVEKLDIKATANDEKATVEITGNEALKSGDNIIKITVTAEDKTTRIYTINASKKGDVKLTLRNMKVDGYTISPAFSQNTLEYKLTILDANVSSINVIAAASDEKAKVEVSGNTDLKQGENIVNIVVTSEDGTESATYKIVVNKSTTPVAKNSSKQNDWILYAGIGIIAFLVIIIVVIIVRSRRNSYYEDDEEYDDDNSDAKNDDYSSDNKFDNGFEFKEYNNFDTSEDKKKLEDELFGELPKINEVDTSNSEKRESRLYNQDNDDSFMDSYGNGAGSNMSSDMQTTEKSYDSYLTNDYDSNGATEDYMSNRDEWNDDDYKPRRNKGKHSK